MPKVSISSVLTWVFLLSISSIILLATSYLALRKSEASLPLRISGKVLAISLLAFSFITKSCPNLAFISSVFFIRKGASIEIPAVLYSLCSFSTKIFISSTRWFFKLSTISSNVFERLVLRMYSSFWGPSGNKLITLTSEIETALLFTIMSASSFLFSWTSLHFQRRVSQSLGPEFKGCLKIPTLLPSFKTLPAKSFISAAILWCVAVASGTFVFHWSLLTRMSLSIINSSSLFILPLINKGRIKSSYCWRYFPW